MFFLAEICERGVEFMNKVVLLYMIALGIFAIPLYLFRNDIFSGMKEKRAYVRKEMKEKNLKKDKEKKIEVSASGHSAEQNDTKELLLDPRRNFLVRATEKALPSVVNIGTERLNRRNDLFFADDPLQTLFEDFLRTQENAKSFSLGSGFVIDESGLILTNAHVVDRASRIHVTLPCGVQGKAETAAFDSTNDIALVRLLNVPQNLPCSTFDFSGKLFLGETVIAAGNPFGLGSSISAGVLSGTKRSFSYNGRILFSDILQSDAIVYPGNSGGPLININGEVIGMNVSFYKNAPGIGFAIPVQRLLEHLLSWMIPERIKKLSFGLIPGYRREKEEKGYIYVQKIIAGTPADLAGLKEGEKIMKINGARVREPLALNRKLIRLDAGEKLVLETDKGKVYTISPRKFNSSDTLKRAEKRLGIRFAFLTEDIANKLRIPVKNGLVVSGFYNSFPAGRIRRGDVLVLLDGKRISVEKDLASILDSGKSGEYMTGVFLAPVPQKTTGDGAKDFPMHQYRIRLRLL